ncbi:MAG: FAD-dependent oxidoreductase [Gammaproteobacteria bacterium]|nr:FAD-dependent oxidoreductase [Gammaproteobacteria bacterium]
MSDLIPSSARVVIIGGGVVGCSVAYHLAHLGYTDVVLLERKKLTSGTTWHAAGLIGQLRATQNLTQMVKYSGNLYEKLEAETGVATGFRRSGSISLATNEERFTEFKRNASLAKVHGVDAHILCPSELKSKIDLFNLDDVVGGVWIPRDGKGDPANIAMALAKGAKNLGVKIFEDVKVTAIHKDHGRITGVTTDQGDIQSEIVVNCGGMWAREVGLMAGANVPLHACEHYYALTSPVENLGDMPTVRVPDESAYYKEDAGKILIGLFEPHAKPWGQNGIPEDFCFDQIPDDLEHMMPYLELAMNRLPAMEKLGLETFFNGPESFTPDDSFQMGECPEVRNFYVAAGFNSIGIQAAGGAGKYMAEWIVGGEPPCDLWEVDVRRMQPFQNNKTYLANRVSESLGYLYENHFPYHQFSTGRGLRRSPLHQFFTDRGACYGEVAGWERPNWFVSPQDLKKGVEAKYEYSWDKQNWFDYHRQEHMAIRESVGMYEMLSFSKIRVKGVDAMDYLQYICANDVDVPIGKIVYTQWLNNKGGIEADVTITRLAKDDYLVVGGAMCANRDMNWLERNLPDGANCAFFDATNSENCLAIMGPNSRDLLQSLTDYDLSHENMPFASTCQMELGMANVRAHRLTYVGELGWEIYFPIEYSEYVAELLVEKGQEFSLKLCGMHAVDSCRTEKTYRHFGHDITDEDNVLEAGLGFAVKTGKNPSKFGIFIGHQAVLEKKEKGLEKRLMQFLLDDPEVMLYHNEPILKNGEVVSFLTSGSYGHALGAAVGLGYINCNPGASDEEILNDSYTLEVAGEVQSVRVSLVSMFDPKNTKIRV